jgi:HMG (high mobility group) box
MIKEMPEMIMLKNNLHEPKDIVSSDMELLLNGFVANPACYFLPHFTGLSFEKPTKKRSWKKPKDKPKRPLSGYNLFFQSERKKLIAMLPEVANLEEYGLTERERKAKHRKMHGKIGFAELARNIAKKWNSLDDTEKAVFEACARTEKEKYQEELDKWKTTNGFVRKRRKRSRTNKVATSCLPVIPVEFSLSNAFNFESPNVISSLSIENTKAYQLSMHESKLESYSDIFDVQRESWNMASCTSHPNQDFTSGHKHQYLNSFVFECDLECRNHFHDIQIKGDVSDSLESSLDDCSTIDGIALDNFMDNSYCDSDYEEDFSI